MQETPLWFLGWEDPLEKGKATHSCILAWRVPWTVGHQNFLCMELSRQEYWTGLPFPSPEDLPHPGIKPMTSLHCGQILYQLSYQESPCCIYPNGMLVCIWKIWTFKCVHGSMIVKVKNQKWLVSHMRDDLTSVTVQPHNAKLQFQQRTREMTCKVSFLPTIY